MEVVPPVKTTYSNKAHDNTKLIPPNTDIIEQLVEQIIHSVPV